MNCKVCENTSAKNISVSFFRFPKESARCRDWAERCNLLNLYETHGTLRFYKSFRICSDHFDPKDVVFDGRKKRLLQSAIPQISTKPITPNEKLNNFNNNEIFKLKLVENLCRLCAEENRNLTDVFGWRGRTLNLEDKLKYFPVVMTKCDVLPLRVCHECISKINQFYDFIMNCMKAETKLRIMLDIEDCDTIKSEWNSQIKPKQEPSNEITETPGTIVDNFNELHQVLQENLSHLNESLENQDYFCEEPETNQSFHTNFIRDVDFSRNISFEHNYSHTVPLDESQPKTQTENDQIEETKLSCDICLETFTSPQLLSAHSLTHSDLNGEFTCGTCSQAFLNRYDLDEHVSTHSGDICLKCPICDREFHEVAFLKKHSLIHHGQILYDCLRPCQNSTEKQCLPTQKKKVLRMNFKSPGGVKRRCQFCDRLFKNRQICLIHERSHTGKTPYECKLCGKGFRSRQSLRQHRSVHSDKRLFTCHDCGMSFKRKDTLRNHLRIHTGERPFVCKICGFAFKQRGDCTKHEKNHERTNEMEVVEDNNGTKPQVLTTVTTKETLQTTFWTEEKSSSSSSLPSFITIAEEITPVDTLGDIVAGRMISFNF